MHVSRLLRVLGTCCLTATFAGCAVAGVTTDADDAPRQSRTGTVVPSTTPSPPGSRSAGRSSASADAGPGSGHADSALAVLETVAVKGRAPMTGYDRAEFGQAWLDADRNGCDTRNDVLARDLTQPSYKPGTRGCVVLSGELADPYTAKPIHFVRGDGDLVDIDHVVALGDAWATGAFSWSAKKRAAVANDPMNLLAVDASANRQKGDGDTATWLPANKSYRCEYVARQVSVKAKYGLWVTAPERAAMERVLATCPGQPAARDSGAPVMVPLEIPDPGRSTTTDPSRGSSGGFADYRTCDDVRAAGAAPIHLGDPGYSRSLDRDGDGTGCE